MPNIKKITRIVGIFAIFLILAGFATWLGFREVNLYFLLMVGLGVILLFPFVFTHIEDLSEMIKTRSTEKGFISIIVAILVVIILLAAYGIARYNKDWRLDLTDDQLYSLSQQTYQILNQLDEKKKYCLIVVVDNPDGFAERMNGRQRYISHNMKQYLKNYEIYSDRVIVKYIDPDRDIPQLAEYELDQKADLGALRISLIKDEYYKKYLLEKDKGKILKEGKDETSQKVAQGMMVEEAPGANFQYTRQMEITGFKVEEAITKAIDTLLGSKQPQIYFLEGNGEFSPDKEMRYLKKVFEDSLFKIKTFKLFRTQFQDPNQKEDSEAVKNYIPKDCDILIIANPRVPYSENQIKVINDYFERGGHGIILADTPLRMAYKAKAVMGGHKLEESFQYGKETNNVELILDKLGITYNSSPIMQIDKESNKPRFPNSNLRGHKITQPLIDKNLGVMLYFPGSLTKAEKLPDGVEINTLIATDSEAYQKVGDSEGNWNYVEDKDKKAAFDLGYMVTKKCDGDKCINPTGNIAVFSDSDFLADYFIGQTNLVQHVDLIKNAAALMAKVESKIAISPRKEKDRLLDMDKETYNHLWAVTVIIIPLLMLLLGLILVYYRRQK